MDFLTQLRQAWPPADWRDVSIVVAISGGADSVSLLCGLHELRAGQGAGRLVAAHFNHRLRPAADDDLRFVQELAKRLGIDCEVGIAAEPLNSSGSDGVEAVARTARYEFLLQIAQRVGARFVATAHTADDQAETVLHRILRGTGLAGLAGIPRIRPLSEAVSLIRPLLEFTRADVVQFLADRGQSFCLDESNEDASYTRNRIRHALLPQLAAQYNPNVNAALIRLGQLAGEAQQVIELRAKELANSCVRIVSADEVQIECEPLAKQPAHLIRELLIQIWKQQQWPQQAMGLEEWTAAANLTASLPNKTNSPTLNLPGNIRAVRQQSELRLVRS